MENYAYDYLNDSLLLDSSLFTLMYQGISDATLEKELLNYREYCIKVLPEIQNTIKEKNGAFSCMMTDTMSLISHLKQAALYLEEAVVVDPLFALTDFRTSETEAMTSFMGVAPTPKIDRQKLAQAAARLIELCPLVVGGYVKLYPLIELEHGSEIPFLYSEVGFEDCLPPSVLKQYKLNADVRSVEKKHGRMLIMKDLYPCRNISIHFKGMEDGLSMVYMLNPTEFKPTDKKNAFTLIQHRSLTPPSKETFMAWIKQSINQTAKIHYIDLYKRIILCESLGCMFGTEHLFESNLLNMNLSSSDIKANTLNCTLSMNVPFLENISSSELMYIRNSDGEAFQSFRSELEKGLRAARYESDINRVRAIVEDTQHELFEVQMNQIAPQVKYIKKTHLAEIGIAVAGLGLSVLTGGASLLATGIAIAHGYKSHNDYKSKVIANPCYFLWNVKQKARNNKKAKGS